MVEEMKVAPLAGAGGGAGAGLGAAAMQEGGTRALLQAEELLFIDQREEVRGFPVEGAEGAGASSLLAPGP